VQVIIEDELNAYGDERLIKVLLDNLIGNAWKYTQKTPRAAIEVGYDKKRKAFFVKDNGAGFDMQHADKLFVPFGRLHSEQEFEGTGVGLATAQRILHRHDGTIWAESLPGQGAAFYFSLPDQESGTADGKHRSHNLAAS
jgi:light-regulated signal transduction histidine kinase (bacteriophytochrome)